MADTAALKALIKQKDEMEREIAEISEALSADNLGGVSTPLVDAEGFPRADVDVHTTRTLRQRLVVLNTDHKALMVRIEHGLHALHAASAPGTTSAAPPKPSLNVSAPVASVARPAVASSAMSASVVPPPSAPAPTPMDTTPDIHDPTLRPFAEIDEVAPEGPAAAAGLLVGDLLLRFGNLDAGNHDQLRALARVTQRSVGDAITVVVQRDAARLSLQLLPRRWSGQGLLGCHLKPL
jgi:26S proteasome non-ATPase regulatory subunit 9